MLTLNEALKIAGLPIKEAKGTTKNQLIAAMKKQGWKKWSGDPDEDGEYDLEKTSSNDEPFEARIEEGDTGLTVSLGMEERYKTVNYPKTMSAEEMAKDIYELTLNVKKWRKA